MSTILDRALQAWQQAAARLDFESVVARFAALQAAAQKLRQDPPAFDLADADQLLSHLPSARRMKRQILEANDPDVLILTLRAFLFDEAPLAEKFATFPSLIRYAGLPILGELYGWVHADQAPVYTRRALATLRALGWQVPPRNYPAFAAAISTLASAYTAAIPPVAPQLPLLIEVDQFLSWLATQTNLLTEPSAESFSGTPGHTAEIADADRGTPHPRSAPPTGSDTRPAKPTRAIREFGSVYGAAPPTTTWADRPLTLPTPAQLAEAERSIRAQLALPPDVVRRAAAHLIAGRHLILTGAPGTGKSHLAHLLTTTLFGYTPMLVTATAEWSAFDVIGGLVPMAEGGGTLRYTIRPGYVYAAVAQNWAMDVDGSPLRDANGHPLRRPPAEAHAPESQGLWLIIDELNRADVDKAFGELFSALETGTLRVPRLGAEGSMLLPIPQDFRILATLNTRDRHFLFTLSDALKRRFAFLELLPPQNLPTERETLLRRAQVSLADAGLPPRETDLAQALDRLLPFVVVARALAPATPLGSAPLLAALRYIGAALLLEEPARGATGRATLEGILEEAVLAEIAPQLEGLRDLPLTLLAHLARGRPREVVATLASEVGAAGPLHPIALQSVAAIAQAIQQLDPAPEEPPRLLSELSQVLDLPPGGARDEAQHRLLQTLRERAAHHLPHYHWPRVAALLEGWLAERVI